MNNRNIQATALSIGMRADDYGYIQHKTAGKKGYRDVLPIADLPPPNGQADCSTSPFLYTDAILEHQKHLRGSLKGYNGPVLAPFMNGDFDNEKDPAESLEDLRRLINRLELLSVPL